MWVCIVSLAVQSTFETGIFSCLSSMLVICTINTELVGGKTSVVVSYFMLKLQLVIVLPLRAVTSSANKDRWDFSSLFRG